MARVVKCRVFSRSRARYELLDLSVTEVLPQQVALSEGFIQIYERA